MAAADYVNVVQQLYVAYFGRPADPIGLANFTSALNNANAPTTIAGLTAAYSTNATIKGLVDSFGTSAESTALYTGSTAAFVNAIFVNVLGRSPALEGLLYWSNAIDSGTLTRGNAAAAIMAGAQTNTTAQGLIDAQVVANRVTVAGNFTAALDQVSEVLAYTGTAAAATARSMLAQVNSTTDTTAFQATVNTTVTTLVDNPPATGTTFTLTTAADTGGSFTGTSGNDTYVSQINADLGTGTSINAGDVLSGSGGTDTLSITVAGASTGNVVSTATTLVDLEKVLVSNFDSNTNDAHDHEFNAALWTGVTTVGLSSSSATGDTGFTNLKNIVAAEMKNGAADLSVSYLASVVTGTADSQALTVDGVTAGTFTADAGIETLAITANGTKSTLTGVTATGASKLTVSGNAALTVQGAIGTTMKTIDASASTGGVSLVLGTADLTVTGGSGNDTIRIDGSTVNTSDSINAGTGTDKLQLTAAANVTTSTNGAKLVGFETIEGYANAADASLVVAQDVSLLGTAPTTVGVSSWTRTTATDDGTDYTATDGVNFTNMAAGTNMALSGFVVTDLDANDGLIDNFTATADLKSDTTADAITVTLGSATAGMAAVTVQDANTAFNLTLSVDDYETVTLTSQGGANTVASLTSGDMTKLVVNATKALTVSAGTWAALATVDASASTANVSLAATTKASTITGGAGNDSFTGSGSADSIDGGAGNDTLNGGAGVDTILGGAGNDQITGGAGNDKLYGGDGDDTFADAGTDSKYIEGGAGNDVFRTALADLTSGDTLTGGDGTDSLVITDANANINLTTDITKLQNVTGVEVIGFTGLDGSDTVTINDGVVSTAGGSLTLAFLTGVAGANTIDASGVLASASSVAFTDLAGLATTYSIGNGKDNANMGDGNDTVTVSNSAYLSTNDTLAGGSGTDTLAFSFDTASSNTITAAQLTNVTGFETFNFANATNGTAVNYTLTLNDTIVGNQVSVGSTFTVTRTAANTGTLKIDGSAVTANYVLALSGGAGVDTLTGGAGNDTITGAAGSDSLTGGAGNDTFVVSGLTAAANGSDIVTDFSFGTSTTAVDVIQIDATSTTKVFGKASTGITAAAGTEILILDQAAYQDASGAQTAARTAFGGNDNAAEAIVIWQDTLGNLNLSVYADTSADATANGTLENSMVKFSGLTLSGVQTLIDAGDFSII